MDPKVYQAFEAFPEKIRDRLFELRDLIYVVAADSEGVGRMEETLKWGQISYLNPAGTTLRIGADPESEVVSIYVHCQTNVVESLKLTTETLSFEGTRRVMLPTDGLDTEEVRRCIRSILTYRIA